MKNISNNNTSAKKLTTANIALYGILIALTTVATMIISIPTIATKGYINLGDAIVLLSGFVLGPLGGFIVGGIGSAMADILLSYAYYAPFTLVIKGIEGFLGVYLYKKLFKEKTVLVPAIIAGLWMATGYLIVEVFMYGAGAAFTSYPSNIIQGLVGAFLCKLLYESVGRFRKK